MEDDNILLIYSATGQFLTETLEDRVGRLENEIREIKKFLKIPIIQSFDDYYPDSWDSWQ